MANDVTAPATARLLVVEDDPEMAALLAWALGEQGFAVTCVGDGAGLDRARRAGEHDLILLDWMLPGEDGMSICRRLRRESAVPILMLTALGDEPDRVAGLDQGADDYLTKPFGTRELVARIRALLRRVAAGGPASASVLRFAGWQLDTAARVLRDPKGVRVVLTAGELDLLLAFCQHPGRVLTRDQLLDLTRGRDAVPFDRSIDTLVSRLRRKLERDPREPGLIVTVRAEGYLFAPQVGAW